MKITAEVIWRLNLRLNYYGFKIGLDSREDLELGDAVELSAHICDELAKMEKEQAERASAAIGRVVQ